MGSAEENLAATRPSGRLWRGNAGGPHLCGHLDPCPDLLCKASLVAYLALGLCHKDIIQNTANAPGLIPEALAPSDAAIAKLTVGKPNCFGPFKDLVGKVIIMMIRNTSDWFPSALGYRWEVS